MREARLSALEGKYFMAEDRIDKVLVARGLFPSRAAAQASIEAGLVRVAGRQVSKPSEKVSMEAKIEAEAVHPYVSRGGVKLAHALEMSGIDPSGLTALDVGASTGGFTDVLLQKGANAVYAVDVGRDQLHSKLRAHPRVFSFEGVDARELSSEQIPERIDLIVCDASFIALEKLLEVPLSFAADGARLVTLFKPQFQVGRAHIGKGGLVKDADAVAAAETGFCEWLHARGWQVMQRFDSSILGGDGNAERFVFAAKS